ncbi:MAG: tetratricopeptide repeat protein [Pseudomonadota bacterium]
MLNTLAPLSVVRGIATPSISTGACLAVLVLGLSACASQESVQVSQDSASIVRLADSLRERGQLATAIAFYQKAAAQSDSAGDLIVLGQALAEAGAYERASDAFRRALVREPGHPDALLGYGTSLLALGDIDKSIQFLEQLVNEGSGTDTKRYSALGAAFDSAGRHDQAVAAYTAGLDIRPDDLDLKTNLALSYVFNDRHVEAINLMIEVTNTLEARPVHHRNHVLVLALAGQESQALATGIRMIGDRETQDVMAQAATLRQLSTGADRARALGVS